MRIRRACGPLEEGMILGALTCSEAEEAELEGRRERGQIIDEGPSLDGGTCTGDCQ